MLSSPKVLFFSREVQACGGTICYLAFVGGRKTLLHTNLTRTT
jgi:hypothetical protein